MKWLLPPVLWLFCLLGMGLFSLIFPHAISSPYNYYGILLVISGLWLLLNAEGKFRDEETNVNTFRNPDKLVTDGVFSWSRNPMYLGFLLSLVGMVVVFSTLHSVVFVITFFVAANFWYIPYEEASAAQQFGSDYEDYKRSVRRWL